MVQIVDRSGRPMTIARVAVYNGDLADAVAKYSQPLGRLDSGESVKFTNYILKDADRSYLLMVSQQRQKRVNHIQGVSYNTSLSVTSRDSDLVARVASQFENETGIQFVDAPLALKQMMQNIGLLFP